MRRIHCLLFAALSLMLVACSGGNGEEEVIARSLEEIGDSRVSVVTGSLYEIELSKDPSFNLIRVNSSAESLAAVANSISDYAVEDDCLLVGLDLEERGLAVAFKSDLMTGDYGVAFRKSNKELCDAFNEFLAKIKADGTYDAICKRWLQKSHESVRMPEIPVSEGAPLRIGMGTFFPFTFSSGNGWVGMEPEIILRFGQYIGRPVEISVFDFSALPAALAAGKIDAIMSCMTITEERAKTVLFSDSYYHVRTAFFCRAPKADAARAPFLQRCKESFHKNLIVEERWKMVLDGLWETVVISFFAILIGTLFGALMCWMRMSGNKVLIAVAKAFLDLMRGLPLLVLLMIMFYIVFATSGVSARWVAIIAFAMNFGAYVSEMFRTSIEGVDRGQTEAGLAMGFTPSKTFLNFVLPQAAAKVQPVYKGEVISLIKNTSIVGYIAIQDLTKMGDIIRSRTFDAFFTLIVVSVIYFLLAWLIGKLLDLLAKKF